MFRGKPKRRWYTAHSTLASSMMLTHAKEGVAALDQPPNNEYGGADDDSNNTTRFTSYSPLPHDRYDAAAHNTAHVNPDSSPPLIAIPIKGDNTERRAAYLVTIPEGVRGGQKFSVLAHGREAVVTCPTNRRAGMTVRILPPPFPPL